jgi:4-hydroxy-3-methylbut-2-enyl diphosphate reductase
VRIALETFGPPIYVRKEIVHNRYVVEELQAKGAIFVDDVSEVPPGERVIYSAHGVAPQVRQASLERKLRVIDATCPLVTKVHVEAVRFARDGYSLILIGHLNHDEIIGTLGEAPQVTAVVNSVEQVKALKVPDPDRVAYLTQTTLSLDEARDIIIALKERFPNIKGPQAQDICYATENRQVAVKDVARKSEQLELEPPGRGGEKPGDQRLSDRYLSGYRSAMAPRRADDRAHGGRLRPRGPGAGGDRLSHAAWVFQAGRN